MHSTKDSASSTIPGRVRQAVAVLGLTAALLSASLCLFGQSYLYLAQALVICLLTGVTFGLMVLADPVALASLKKRFAPKKAHPLAGVQMGCLLPDGYKLPSELPTNWRAGFGVGRLDENGGVTYLFVEPPAHSQSSDGPTSSTPTTLERGTPILHDLTLPHGQFQKDLRTGDTSDS